MDLKANALRPKVNRIFKSPKMRSPSKLSGGTERKYTVVVSRNNIPDVLAGAGVEEAAHNKRQHPN